MLASMSEGHGDDYLQKRYGSRPKRGRSWLIPAAILLIVGGGWLLWSANHYSRPEIRTELISFSVSDPNKVRLRYFIAVRSSNRAHQCILKAIDYQANVVGQITDSIPAGGTSYTRNVEIPTRTPAVSASIEHCS